MSNLHGSVDVTLHLIQRFQEVPRVFHAQNSALFKAHTLAAYCQETATDLEINLYVAFLEQFVSTTVVMYCC